MSELRSDVVVLGAGMVGVSAALHLQQRGRSVTLVDRTGMAGEETSYGNAGLIERASVFPYAFPREIEAILRYALWRAPEARYRIVDLPALAPWLLKYYRASAPDRALRSAAGVLPLITRSLAEHEALINEAGVPELLKRMGWIKAFRTSKSFEMALGQAKRAKEFGGVEHNVLDPAGIAEREPHLTGDFVGAIHWPQPGFVPDPGALAKAYAGLFTRKGGVFRAGDARSLEQVVGGWRITTADGPLVARDAVIALGPWSMDVFRPLGYRIPLAVKRGYHLHVAPKGNAVLNHPVLDSDQGFLIAPMNRGVRITTGVEFADRDAPPNYGQVEAALPRARALFPLGDPVDAKPWKGARPCLPDMLPVIGPAPRHKGLWFDFGHQHHGLTLGPASGRLLSEIITGQTPFADPAPFSSTRFG